MQTQLTATRSELSKAREDLDKVAALPETVNLLVSQIKRLEARFDLLPPPFDPTEVWQQMHGLATVVHKTEHNLHVLEARQSEVMHMIAVEDAADEVVAGLDHNTFLQAGDVLEPGKSDFDLEVSVKGKNKHSAYSKNAYTTSTTKLSEVVANQVEKVSKRSLAKTLHRASLVSTPMTETALLLHNDTFMKMDAARIFYRWRDVWRNRRNGGFKVKLCEEEDWEQTPEIEWDVSYFQTAAHIAQSQHTDFEALLAERKKEVEASELAERRKKLEDEKYAALLEKDPEAAAAALAEREKAELEAQEKAAKEAEEAEPPQMYGGAELAGKFAEQAGIPEGAADRPLPTTRGATAHDEPDGDRLQKILEDKVQRKMAERMELLRLGADSARIQQDADVFGQVQASHTETIDRLLQDSLAMQEAMGMLDESARRAAMAAMNAGAQYALALPDVLASNHAARCCSSQRFL